MTDGYFYWLMIDDRVMIDDGDCLSSLWKSAAGNIFNQMTTAAAAVDN